MMFFSLVVFNQSKWIDPSNCLANSVWKGNKKACILLELENMNYIKRGSVKFQRRLRRDTRVKCARMSEIG